VNSDSLCFILFQGTGVGLLLRHPDGGQHVENSFTFDFQLSGEIVDSNLAHPAFRLLRVVLRYSLHPHGVSFFMPHVLKLVFARVMTIL
jgi:hypothetical protein